MIRSAKLEDINELTSLFNSYRVFYRQESNLEAAKKFLEERLNLNESIVLIKVIDDKMIGFVQIYPSFSSISMKPIWILNDLFVEENFRGKGAAKELLNRVKEMAISEKVKYISLKTAFDNRPAQNLYKNDGWKMEEDFLTFNFHL